MNKNFTTIQDLLDDDSFVQWVVLGQHDARWQEFLKNNAHRRSLIEKARQLIQQVQEAENKDLPSLDHQMVWSKIQAKLSTTESRKEKPTRRLSSLPALQWAASLVLLVGLGWVLWTNQNPEQVTYENLVESVATENTLLERANVGESPLKVALEDGSVVLLSKNSRLSYPQTFEKNQRTVILTGEAFFEVAKDPKRPFFIHANEVVTKVLGTSFRIRAFEEDKEVVVQVRTGRVSVYKRQRADQADPETKGLVLVPNQQAVFTRANNTLSRSLVEVPLPLATSPEIATVRRYDEVPATKILHDIEQQYGISILFDEEVLRNCVLTTTLGNESLYEKLDLVCTTIGATYKEVDAQLIVQSKGCL